VNRLPSQLVALLLDKRGKLTRYRAFRLKERVNQHCKRIIRLKTLPRMLRYDLEEEVVRPIQAFVRYRQRKQKIVTCQRFARGYLARRKLRRQHAAARRLQNWWRTLPTAQRKPTEFQLKKQIITKLQAAVRGHACRKRMQMLVSSRKQQEDEKQRAEAEAERQAQAARKKQEQDALTQMINSLGQEVLDDHDQGKP
jgi:hypothetical protein